MLYIKFGKPKLKATSCIGNNIDGNNLGMNFIFRTEILDVWKAIHVFSSKKSKISNLCENYPNFCLEDENLVKFVELHKLHTRIL